MSDVTPPPPPAPEPTPYAAAAAPARPSPVLSIISLVAGILSFVGGLIVFIPIIGSILHLFLPLTAVILGFLGKKKEPTAKGMWLTGIILGFIGLATAIISLIVWIGLIAVAGTSSYNLNF